MGRLGLRLSSAQRVTFPCFRPGKSVETPRLRIPQILSETLQGSYCLKNYEDDYDYSLFAISRFFLEHLLNLQTNSHLNTRL